MTIVYVGLGSNLGDRLLLLARAVHLLATPRVKIGAVSSVYETAPQGIIDQPSFLNLVVQVETDLPPRELLGHTQAIEAELGRVRDLRWGPRTVDLDILLYGDQVLDEDGFQIPHAQMVQRAFVLVPLLELNPDLILPPMIDDRLVDRLAALTGQGVGLYMETNAFRESVARAGQNPLS